ncbi:MAG: sulfatase-like hydrolase/transferase [Planctomycetota bacterium]
MRAVAIAWLVHVAIGTLIGTQYLAVAPPATTLTAQIFVATALVSSTAVLSVIPGLPLLAVAAFVARPRVLAWLQAVVWTLFQLALFVDTRLYRIFRYHFNGMVWNVITTPGSEDAVELGAQTYVLVLGTAAVVCVCACFAWTRWIWPRRDAQKLVRCGVIALVVCILVEKGLYAAADLRRDRRVLALASVFWLYQPLTLKKLASRTFGMKLAERPRVALAEDELLLQYPRARPSYSVPARKPNVLVIVIDSLRKDAFTPETMPHTTEFARTARRFDDHISGSNCTRFGIFTLIYGIHGSYWKVAYQEQAPPVLVTELARLGYDQRVLSTASMNFPEFRSTCWVTIEDKVEDQLPSKVKHERDTLVGERFAAWMDARDVRAATEPFFCFALLDAPHGTHSFPADRAPFQPSAKTIDYLSLADQPSPEQVRQLHNSYRNAVLHADGVVGRMLDELRKRDELEDTLVVITGDHGEEFMEHGYYGHTSNYTPEQVRVTFVLDGPDVMTGVETRPTSHLDLVPTILETLGADVATRRDYTFGLNLFDPPATRVRVLSGWQEMAIWVPDGVLFLPLEGHKGFVEARGYDWKPLANEDEVIERYAGEIARMARECRWFLR